MSHKETEPALEKVFISVEGGNINIYDMTDNVVVNVTEHDNKEAYVAIKNEKGKIETRPAGKYRPTEETVLCSHCSGPALVKECVTGISSLGRGETCVLCHSWVCHDCVDWKCMVETGTDPIVCKECSKLFENCKGGN